MLGEEGDRGNLSFPRLGGGTSGGDLQVVYSGCGGRGFDTCGCFLLRLSSSPFRLHSLLRYQLRRGIWIGLLDGGVVALTTPSPLG